MALNIKLNFEDCYPIVLTDNILQSTFNTVLYNGDIVPIGIQISEEEHHIIPKVHNLAFGPIDKHNQIDDRIRIRHQNYSKLFSTIVFTSLAFLQENSDKFVGIDGSNNARAYMYYRGIQNNFDYLNNFVDMYGVNYYVRVLRKLKDDDEHYQCDSKDVISVPQLLVKEAVLKYEKLYNYFIFRIKPSILL